MQLPDFLQSKQNQITPEPWFKSVFKDKKKFSFIVLVVLLFAIPLGVWLSQRTQIFKPRAQAKPIELVQSDGSCVVSSQDNKVSCTSFPIKLISPLGPPSTPRPSPHIEPGATCTDDNQCSSGQICFNHENFPGICRDVDTVCTQVITRACNPENLQQCVDFPTPCHVPPGWVNPNTSPSPLVSSSPACTTIALSKVPTVNSQNQVTYTYTYPASTKITNINIPGQPGLRYSMNGQTSASGQSLALNLGAGLSSFQFAVLPDAACSPYTVSFTMTNNCGATMSDFVGAGSASTYGAVCQGVASPSPDAIPSPTHSGSGGGSTTGVSSGTDELGVNLQSQGMCQSGAPVVLFSNQGRSDTNNFKLYRNGQPLNYTFAGTMTRPPITQMKDTGLNLNTTYSYYIQAVDGPLVGKRSNTSTVSTPSSCPSLGFNFWEGFSWVNQVKAQSQAATVSEGLVSYWKFDESSGSIAFDSKGLSNGTTFNTTIVDGKSNKAKNISNQDSFVSASNKPEYNSDYFTVAGWIKPTTFGLNNFESFFSRRNAENNYGMTLEYAGYQGLSDGQIQCQVHITGTNNQYIPMGVVTQGNEKLTSNQWNHIACSYDGLVVKVYINGILVESANASGKMRSLEGIDVVMGKNPFGEGGMNAVIDEIGLWNRALTDLEIGYLAQGNLPEIAANSPSPTGVGSASPSPVSNGPGTVSFKIAESEAGLESAEEYPYTTHGQLYDFAFSDASPGIKQIWVKFIGADNSSKIEHINVELVEPGAQLTSLECSLDILRQDLKILIKGERLGTSRGKVSVDSKEAQITSWDNNQILAVVKPNGSTEGKRFKVVLTRADGNSFPEVACQVDTALVSLGARLFCRTPGKFDVSGVKAVIVDEHGNKVNEEVTIDAEGVIKGLKTRLQVDRPYTISIKAPHSLRKNADFIGSYGTTVVMPKDDEVFILPVGDIAPVVLQDGKINTLDRAEIVRQWSVLGSGDTRSADFNRDSKVNSMDWACMRFDFNKEDEKIPDKATGGILPTPSIIPLPSVSSLPLPSASTLTSPLPSGQRVAYFLLEPLGGGLYKNGDEFIVDINIWSQKEAANLFAAKIQFDETALEVRKIERGTILTSWAEEFVDNDAGRISLVAGKPTPGLKTIEGDNPRMARIVFLAKKVGTTEIRLTSDSKIYSNSDNLNILTSLLSAQIAITN